MGSTFLHLLVVFLGFSHLICFNAAVPVSRTRSLVGESQGLAVSENTQLENKEEIIFSVMKNIMRRMDVEINDYPGSGANNRHTPWKGCVDC